jgi:hypothetical protein
MAATTLLPPGPGFATTPLDIEMVPSEALYRVSGHDSGEPFFGRSGANRFDDPNRVKSKRFGTCYLGLSLKVAFAESVLHDLEPSQGTFYLPDTEITRRFALSFTGPELRLANLTGTALLLLGGNAELSGTSNYVLSQQWARAVARHPDDVDGFLFMSRRVNDSLAVVLFQRDATAPPKLTMANACALDKHPDFLDTLQKFRVKPAP